MPFSWCVYLLACLPSFLKFNFPSEKKKTKTESNRREVKKKKRKEKNVTKKKPTLSVFIQPQDGSVSLFWVVELLLGDIASELLLSESLKLNLPLKEYTLIIIPLFCFSFCQYLCLCNSNICYFPCTLIAMKIHKILTLRMMKTFRISLRLMLHLR